MESTSYLKEIVGACSDYLCASQPIAVLTGAGCRTASGMPDSRDHDGEWKHTAPVMYADFLNKPSARARYWARSASCRYCALIWGVHVLPVNFLSKLPLIAVKQLQYSETGLPESIISIQFS